MRRTAILAVALSTATALTACAVPDLKKDEPLTKAPKDAQLSSGLDLNGMDRSASAGDSLFEFANGGWMHGTDIPPDRAEIGTFADLRVHVEDQLRTVVEQAESQPDGGTAQKVGDFYASCIDTSKRDELKAAPLNGDFAAVDKLADPVQLVSYLGTLQRFDISDPIRIVLRPENELNASNVVVAAQGDLTLPDRDYYISPDPKSVAVRDAYKAYIAKMLALAGTPNPDAAAASAFDLEIKLARLQWSGAQNQDPVATSTRFTIKDAQARTGLDWRAYLDAVGLDNAKDVVIAQPSYFTGLSDLVRSTPLPAWKSYLRWHLIANAAPYLSSDFVDAQFDFTSKYLGGAEKNREQWRQGISCVNAGMGEALGELYAKQYFSADAKKRVDRIVANVLASFKASIDTMDWMSPPTKAQAREKLSKLVVKTAYPYWWRDWSLMQVKRDDLIGNLRRAGDLEARRNHDKLGDPDRAGGWAEITPQTVNASYNALRNEATFPAAILQPPFFDPGADDAVNYGAIGAVIGHEISHAFDLQGRQFDASGKLRDWWTPADARAFKEKSDLLVARFNGFSALSDTKVDGKRTLGENMADLSGLSVAYKAFLAQQGAPSAAGGGKSPDLDGFTGAQRFFIGYARLYRSKVRDAALRQSLRTDPHSPGRFRTDGVVNNLDEFYTAWDVQPGEPAYLPPDQRIRTW
jgi:predicted metalloendopeptidase